MALFSLTHLGQQIGLRGTGVGTNGGILNSAAKLRLYSGASTPSKLGTGFVNIASGNGYAPWILTGGDWVFGVSEDDYRITLTNRSVVATGVITNIAGAYLATSGDAVLAWFSHPPITLQPGAILDLTSLAISG